MQDIAQLGFSIDSTPAQTAAQNLDRMAQAAAGAQMATGNLSTSSLAYQRAMEQVIVQQNNMIEKLTASGAAFSVLQERIPRVAAEIDSFRQRLDGVADTVDRRVTASLRSLAEETRRAGETFRGVDLKSWAERAQAGFAALYREAESFFRITGQAPASLMQFQYVTEKIGSSVRETATSLNRLSEAIQGISTQGRDVRQILARYGIEASGSPNELVTRFADRVMRAPAGAQRTQDIMSVFGTNDPDVVNRVAAAQGLVRGETSTERDYRFRAQADMMQGIRLRMTAEAISDRATEYGLASRAGRDPDFIDRMLNRQGNDPLSQVLRFSDRLNSAAYAGNLSVINSTEQAGLSRAWREYADQGISGWFNPGNLGRMATGAAGARFEALSDRVRNFLGTYEPPLVGTADEVLPQYNEQMRQFRENDDMSQELAALEGRAPIAGAQRRGALSRGRPGVNWTEADASRMAELRRILEDRERGGQRFTEPRAPVITAPNATGLEALTEEQRNQLQPFFQRFGLGEFADRETGRLMQADYSASSNLLRLMGPRAQQIAAATNTVIQGQLADPTYGMVQGGQAAVALSLAAPGDRAYLRQLQQMAQSRFGSPMLTGLFDGTGVPAGVRQAIGLQGDAYANTEIGRIGQSIGALDAIRGAVGRGGAATENEEIRQRSIIELTDRGMSSAKQEEVILQRLNEAQARRNLLLTKEEEAVKERNRSAEDLTNRLAGGQSLAQATVSANLTSEARRRNLAYGSNLTEAGIAAERAPSLRGQLAQQGAYLSERASDAGQVAGVMGAGGNARDVAQIRAEQQATQATAEAYANAMRLTGQARDEEIQKLNTLRTSIRDSVLALDDFQRQMQLFGQANVMNQQAGMIGQMVGMTPLQRLRAQETMGLMGPALTEASGGLRLAGRVAAAESGGDPNAVNRTPGMSARGLLGITNGMWQQYASRLGLRDDQRMDPGAQVQIFDAFSEDMRRRHRGITDEGIYQAWAVGPGVYPFMRDAPDADAYQTYRLVAGERLAEQAFSANGRLMQRGMTNAQVLQAFSSRLPGASGGIPQQFTSAVGNLSGSRERLTVQQMEEATAAILSGGQAASGSLMRGRSDGVANLEAAMALARATDPYADPSLRSPRIRALLAQSYNQQSFGIDREIRAGAYEEDMNRRLLDMGPFYSERAYEREAATSTLRRRRDEMMSDADFYESNGMRDQAGSMRDRASRIFEQGTRALDTRQLARDMQEFRNAGQEALGTVSQGFVTAVINARNYREALTGVTQELSNIAQRLASRQLEKLAGFALDFAVGAFSGGAGSYGATAAGMSIVGASGMMGGGVARGGIHAGGMLYPFSGGGVLDHTTVFPLAGGGVGMAAEMPPGEAVMPLRRTADGRLGVAASGDSGGGAAITQNINVNFGGGQGGQVSPEQARMVAAEIQKAARAAADDAIRSNMRVGGMFNPTYLGKGQPW